MIHLSNLSTDENIPLTVPGGLHVSSLQYNAAAGAPAAEGGCSRACQIE